MGRDLVEAVLHDLPSASVSEKERKLFLFIEKVNDASPTITAADVEILWKAGWSDEAIYDAVTVCALFNFYNRWCDATGVHGMRPESYLDSGKRLARFGYNQESS